MLRSFVQPLWRPVFGAWCELNAVRRKSPSAAWRWFRWRDRILSTPPIPVPSQGPCEIHALTSAADWRNLVWSLKSFYHFSPVRYPLVIHEDGSLPESACAALAAHFPGLRLIRCTVQTPHTLALLAPYPRCRQLRASNTLSRKVFDLIATRNAPRVLLLDSDLLFFSNPDAVHLAAAAPADGPNLFNGDVASAYTVSLADARNLASIDLIPRINSGLALLHASSLRLDWCEELLALPNMLSHPWRIEQTLFALLSCRYGAALLPAEYDVRLESGGPFGPVRHYVGAVRHLMYGEGMERLVRSGFLSALRNSA